MATKDQLIASAQKYLEKGQIAKAIKDYQELLKLEPKVDQHKQKLADLLCRANLKSEALGIYNTLAKGYAERGFFAKGVAVYKQMQRLDPANPEIYLRLAELNRSLGLNGNAMSEYRTLLELYEKNNKVVETADVLQKMVELEPDNINLQLRVLQNFLREKLYVKATETILKACEVCAKSGDSTKSQKILQSILTHLPDNSEFHNELASRLSATGLYSDAIFVFHALLKRSPQDPRILSELATLYDKIDDAKNDLLFLDQLLAVQPTGAVAERLVRRCLLAGDYGRALRILEEHEALLDDENHTLLISLYQELESHHPGNQRLRSAIARFTGGAPQSPPAVEVPLAPPAALSLSVTKEDIVLPETTEKLTLPEEHEDFAPGAEEFGLHDLLSVRPRNLEVTSPPPVAPLASVEEELVDVSIELSLDEAAFDIDSHDDDLTDVAIEIAEEEISVEEFDDTLEGAAAPTFNVAGSQDDVALADVNIDFDFSEFDDDAVEIEVETDAFASLGIELAGTKTESRNEADPTLEFELDLGPGTSFPELLSQEPAPSVRSYQDDSAQSFSEIDYGFAELMNDSPQEAASGTPDSITGTLDSALFDELIDDDDILELEPMEGEDEFDAGLAELEELLATEMEESPPEQSFVDMNRFTAAVADFEPPVFEDGAGDIIFDETAELEPLVFEGGTDDIVFDEAAAAAPLVFEESTGDAVFGEAVDTLPLEEDDFFDLAAGILDDGALEATEGLNNVGEIDRFRFDSVFSEFKKGVNAQIAHEDTEAHYDLGIAYKEMGLRDDAIDEFKKSMRDPKRLADSLILIGICYAEKGAFAEAETVFTTAIARPEVQAADRIGTQYELGLVYEVWGRLPEALRTFETVAHSDPAFRNVGEKIEELRFLISSGSGKSVTGTPGAASPGKNRVSFV